MKNKTYQLSNQQTKNISGGVVGGGCTGPAMQTHVLINPPNQIIDSNVKKMPAYVTLAIDENGGAFPFI